MLSYLTMFEHILLNIQSNLAKVKDTLLLILHDNHEMLRICGKIEDINHEQRLHHMLAMINVLVRVLIREKMTAVDTISLSSIATIIPLDTVDDQNIQQPVYEDLKKYMHEIYALTEFLIIQNNALKQEVQQTAIINYPDKRCEYDLYRVIAEVHADIQLVLDGQRQSSRDEERNVNKVTPPSPLQRSERMIIDIENNETELDDASVTRLTNSADSVTPLKPLSYDNIKLIDSEESRKYTNA